MCDPAATHRDVQARACASSGAPRKLRGYGAGTRSSRLLCFVSACLAASCTGTPAATWAPGVATTPTRSQHAVSAKPQASPTSFPRPAATSAPQPAGSPHPELASLLDACGPGDAALHRAATKLLEPELLEQPLDASAVTFALRTSGSPYVKARGLRTTLVGDQRARLAKDIDAWLLSAEPPRRRRCGIALAPTGDRLAMVIAQAAAELDALPTQVPPGSNVAFHALLLEPTTHAELVLLEPNGALRPLASILDGQNIDSSFYLDRPGVHRLQLIVDTEGGPSAALEAWLAVGEPLPRLPLDTPVPGETASLADRSAQDHLTTMLNTARSAAGLAPLHRSGRLDSLAQAHAEAMQRAELLAHDVGNGNPLWRVQEAGIRSKTTGENLALAPDIRRAHRAIWRSPAHRANLLGAHFDTIGIGIAQGPNEQLWVCELLTDEH